jgi:hypothetical protein
MPLVGIIGPAMALSRRTNTVDNFAGAIISGVRDAETAQVLFSTSSVCYLLTHTNSQRLFFYQLSDLERHPNLVNFAISLTEQTLEPANPQHLATERTCPSKLPSDYHPIILAYCARSPKSTKGLVMAFIRFQQEKSPVSGENRLKLLDFMRLSLEDSSPLHHELATYVDPKWLPKRCTLRILERCAGLQCMGRQKQIRHFLGGAQTKQRSGLVQRGFFAIN